VTATYAGDVNHTGSSDTATVTIGRATSTTAVAVPSGLTYDGVAHAATARTTGAGGLDVPTGVSYEKRDANGTWRALDGTPTDAGDYRATATYGGDANHTGSSDTQTFSIARAKATLTVSGYSGTYDGDAHAAAVTLTGVNGEALAPPVTVTYDGSTTIPVAVGTYAVTATFAGNDNYEAATDVGHAVIIGRTTVTASGNTLAAVEGAAFAGALVSFTDTNAHATAADFAAVTIDWGDGTTSAGTVQANGRGGFDVVGTHTYRHFGTFVPSVVLQDLAGRSQAVAAAGTVNVSDAALHVVAPTPLTANKGKTAGTLLAFTDDNAFARYADYTVRINWGDGTTSAGMVVADPFRAGVFDVLGSHSYATGKVKSYTATISVSDDGGLTWLLRDVAVQVNIA
jgi:hypothetical protein